MPGDWAAGSKSSTCSKCGISGLNVSRSSYICILTATYQESFILGLKILYKVGSHSITFNPWVPARVVIEVKTSKSSKYGIFASFCVIRCVI